MGSRIQAKKSHTEQYWQNHAPATMIRCSTNYSTTGTRCRREAYPGATVCWEHGARLPTVQAAAARRIGDSAEDMVKKLIEWANDPTVDMRERVKIAQDMLDRSGHNATSKHLVGVVGGDPVEQLFLDLFSTPGMLVDPSAAPHVTAPPSKWDLEVLEADERQRVVPGEVVVATPHQSPSRPLHTVHVTEPLTAPMPKHIREALDELL